MQQTTNAILMVRPVGFRMNEQTAVNNYYQQELDRYITCYYKCISAKRV